MLVIRDGISILVLSYSFYSVHTLYTSLSCESNRDYIIEFRPSTY